MTDNSVVVRRAIYIYTIDYATDLLVKAVERHKGEMCETKTIFQFQGARISFFTFLANYCTETRV